VSPHVHRLRLVFRVQMGQRLLLLLAADALLVVQGVFTALLGGGEPDDFYLFVALVPLLLLTPAALSDLVALERRAGTLDLTLSLGSRETLLLLRAGVPALLIGLQAGLVMIFVWWTEPQSVPLVGVLLQLFAVACLLAAASLFAALYVPAAGGAWLTTLGIVAVLAPWSLFNPVPPRLSHAGPHWIADGGPHALAVLTGATLLAIAYSLRRLRRPEVLLQ